MGDQTVIHYPFIQTDQNPHGSSGLTSLPELVVGRSTCDQEKVRGHTTAVDHVPTLLPEMPEARIPLLSVQQQHRFFFFFFWLNSSLSSFLYQLNISHKTREASLLAWIIRKTIRCLESSSFTDHEFHHLAQAPQVKQ